MRKVNYLIQLGGLLSLGLILTIMISSLQHNVPAGQAAPEETTDYTLYFPYMEVTRRIPAATSSYYIKDITPAKIYALGQQLGEYDRDTPGKQDHLVFLFFGQHYEYQGDPIIVLLSTGTYISFEQASQAVIHFADGYWDYLGDDYQSQLMIGMALNNYGPDVNATNGERWSNAVYQVDQYLFDNNRLTQIRVAGGGNLELGFNGPTNTQAWINGFHNSQHSHLWFYTVGDAQGCPPFGACKDPWTQEHIWYINWGVGRTNPVPMIYSTAGGNAKQWYQLSLYAYENHGIPFDFAGVMTQYAACQQRTCIGTDNTPEEGYTQLDSRINANPDTADYIRWSTDVLWQGE